MEFEFIEILQVSFSTIFIIISIIVGILLISKYFKYKEVKLLLAGIIWIGMTTPWLSGAISFPLMLFFDTSLSVEVRFAIGLGIVPIILILWMILFTDLVCKKKQKLVLIPYIAIVACFEIVFFIFLFTDTALIGTYTGSFKVEWTLWIKLTTTFFIITVLITGLIFALKSMRSDNPEIKLKGKFLLVAFISFVAGATLDSLIPITPIAVVFTRLLLISSAIEFYFGFFLPKIVKKIFLKQETI